MRIEMILKNDIKTYEFYLNEKEFDLFYEYTSHIEYGYICNPKGYEDDECYLITIEDEEMLYRCYKAMSYAMNETDEEFSQIVEERDGAVSPFEDIKYLNIMNICDELFFEYAYGDYSRAYANGEIIDEDYNEE